MTRTKRRSAFFPTLIAFFTLISITLNAQCPQVSGIMIDACGTEQLNEFIIIQSGGGFNTADIELDYDANNNILTATNNDINTNNNNFSGDPTPCGLVAGNTAAFSGCPNLISVGPGVQIPPNSTVVLQNSSNSGNNTYNFSSLCGSGQCVYVIASSCVRTAGGFTNGAGAGLRTTNFSIAGSCNQTITYNQALVTGGNGAYYLPLTNAYGNGGCVVPPQPAVTTLPPNITDIPDVTVCGTYTLPAITGTNLTANVSYYTAPNGGGTQLSPGDEISTTSTIYIFDQNGPVGCTDQEQFTVTIGSAPTVNQPADVTVCGGNAVNVPITGSPGATFPWTNDNTAIGLGASGTGNIVFTSANVTNTEVALITITPTQGACMGTPVTFSITVNPKPTVDPPIGEILCGGDILIEPFSGSGNNPTYNWTNNNTNTGLPASGSGTINFTAPYLATNQTSTITVTATENGCTGPPQTFTISVKATPVMTQPNNVTVCSGQTVNVNFTALPAGSTFDWTNDNPAIGLAATGSGNISFVTMNAGGQQTATITVTPSINGCQGVPKTFTITVNPTPSVDNPGNQAVCAGDPVSVFFTSPTSPVFNWTNSNPAIGLPASGSGNLSFTAANVASNQTATITVTPVEGTCTGTPITFTITVSPLPTVNQPGNVIVCANDPVAVNFTGSAGTTFSWTNDNPAIGLGASGTGNISFTSATVNVLEIATITVTPTKGNCDGLPKTFTITVKPEPVMVDPADVTACGGEIVDVVFNSSTGAPTYTWVNSNPAIGLPASGNGNITFTASQVGSTQTATITVTPNDNGCIGAPQTFTISVSPAPTMSQPGNVAICANQSILINFSGSAGATFNWTNSNTAIGLPASGTGNINLTAANVATQQVATITVTPSNNGCNGLPVTFTVTINPLPVVNTPANVSVCTGDPVAVNFTGSAGATFSWTNNNPAIGLGASGTGNISFNASNGATQQVATITVTPKLGNNCPGTPVTFTITVTPGTSVNNPGNFSACVGDPVAVNFTGTGNPTFNWTNSNPAIGLGASGTGNISFNAANVATPQTGTITVTPSGAGCSGAAQTFTITVGPVPALTQPANVTACGTTSVNVPFNPPAGVTVNWTNSNPAIGLAASGTGNLVFTAADVATPQTATITATPSLGSCTGTAVSFTIKITPSVTVDSLPNQTVCGGDSVHVHFTGTGSPLFSWTNDNPAVGLAASGTGDLAFLSAIVATPQTATITVTPESAFGNFAYVTNFGSDNVSVINTLTNQLVATIPVGDVPRGVSVSPDGSRIYVANNFANTVSVIDAATNTVIATVPVGNGPLGIAVSPDGSKIYVANTLSNNLTVIDAATNTVIATIPGISQPNGLVVSPDGSRVYVAVFGAGNVAVISTATNTVIGTIPAGNGPIGIAMSPDGSRIYVTNEFSNNVTVIDATNNTVVATIAVGTTPFGVTVSPDGTRVYVANETTNNVSVIDAATNTVIATVPVGNGPMGLSVTADGQFVYVANFVGSNVSVINTMTNTVVNTLPAGQAPVAFGNFISNVSGTCTGTPRTFTITVSPAPTLPAPNNTVACGNQTVNIKFTPSAGATVNWTNSNPAIGLPASGTGNLLFTAAAVAAPQTATITATPVLGTCSGPAATFTITVNPPVSGSVGGDLLLCAGETSLLTASGGGTYEWNSGETTDTLRVTPVVPTSYTVIITNGFNCATAVSVLVDVNPSPVVAISGNTTLCGGQPTTLTASGGGTYAWNNAGTAAGITVTPTTTTTYTVTVTNLFVCSTTASATVTVNPTDTIQITAVSCNPADTGTVVQLLTNQFGCDSMITTVTSLAPHDSIQLNSFTCNPNQAGTFVQHLTNQFGCDSTIVSTVVFDPAAIDTTQLSATTCDPTQAGTTQLLLTGSDGCDSLIITTTTLLPADTTQVSATTCDPTQAGVSQTLLSGANGCDSLIITTTTLLPADTTQVSATTCDPTQAGVTQTLLSGANGCDSLIITTTTLLPADTTQVSATTCDPTQAGVTQTLLSGANGCDSLVITTTMLLPTDTVHLSSFTCNPNQAGTFTQTLSNQFGCDSTVISTVVFDPAAIDTTQVSATTCDPAQAGTSQVMLTGGDGCDSLVITTTTLLPADTTQVSANTCDPAQAGTFVQHLMNQAGCDSMIVTTVTLRPTSTTNLTATTCDPAQVGTFTQTLKNQFGCDSTIVTTVTLSPSDVVNLAQTTCDPTQAGTFTQHLKNHFGCDSTVMTTVTLLQRDTVAFTLFTCDSASAGVVVQHFTNQFGCDSMVVLTSVFDPSLIDITFLTANTCDPAQAGTTQTMLNGSDGCDSLVVLTKILQPSDTLTVTAFTCDPAQAGIFKQVLQNQFGCDSVLISEVIFDPAPCAPAVVLSNTGVTCGGGRDGSFTVNVQNGVPPLQYNWSGGGGQTGSGQITDITVPLVIGNLPVGTYTITVTDPKNQASAVATVTIGGPPVLSTTAKAELAFNGFATSCNGSADGTVSSTALGGTPTYQYAWNTGATAATLTGVAAGTYTLTITDSKGCTATSTASVTQPPALSFALTVDKPVCGDSLADARIQAGGGASPYVIKVDGNVIAGTMPALSSGTHVVSLTDANGCSADSSVTLNLPPVPQIFLPADTSVVLGHPLRIEATTNLSVWNLLQWQPLPDTSCADCFVQEWTPLQSQIIKATIVDTFGCPAEARIQIIVKRFNEFYVPNVFSPDGDGKNDDWVVNAGPSVAEIQEVQVFDRWGDLQYQWNTPLPANEWPGWDGTTRGKKAGLGVYVYYFKIKLVDGTTEVVKGDVTIVKER